MSTTAEKSKPKGTNWAALTDADWATGYAAIAARLGVSRTAAQNAHKRLQARHGEAATTGRPTLNRPANLDTSLPAAEIARQNNVSLGTVYKWLREAGA